MIKKWHIAIYKVREGKGNTLGGRCRIDRTTLHTHTIPNQDFPFSLIYFSHHLHFSYIYIYIPLTTLFLLSLRFLSSKRTPSFNQKISQSNSKNFSIFNKWQIRNFHQYEFPYYTVFQFPYLSEPGSPLVKPDRFSSNENKR